MQFALFAKSKHLQIKKPLGYQPSGIVIEPINWMLI